MNDPLLHADEPTRRQVLSRLACGLFGLTVLPLIPGQLLADDPAPASPAAPRFAARRLIHLFMAGGMSHLDTVDPKPGHEHAGPVQAIPTAVDGIQVSQYLPKLATRMRDVALVRSLTSTQGAHEQGTYFMRTSFQQRGTIRHPTLGAWLSNLRGSDNPTLPAYVAVGLPGGHPGAGWMDARHGPMPVSAENGLANSRRPASTTIATFDRRQQALGDMDARFLASVGDRSVRADADLHQAAIALMQSKDLAAFDITQEAPALRAAYGDNGFGRGCLLARRLIEHDVPCVEVNLGGWDTHDDNFNRVEDVATTLDGALSSLLADLAARGLLDDTLVVATTEFGRTPRINERQGRDHYPKAFSALVAGAGIRRGSVHGATDAGGAEVVDGKITVPDFNATIAQALGLPWHETYTSPEGRPFHIADKGTPVASLLA